MCVCAPVCVCMYVCMRVCMYGCMDVCLSLYVSMSPCLLPLCHTASTHASLFAHVCASRLRACMLLNCHTAPAHASLSAHLHTTPLCRVCYCFATHPPHTHHFLRTCTPLACAVSATSLPRILHACITFCALARHSPAPFLLLLCRTPSTHASRSGHLHTTRLRRVFYFVATQPPRIVPMPAHLHIMLTHAHNFGNRLRTLTRTLDRNHLSKSCCGIHHCGPTYVQHRPPCN